MSQTGEGGRWWGRGKEASVEEARSQGDVGIWTGELGSERRTRGEPGRAVKMGISCNAHGSLQT